MNVITSFGIIYFHCSTTTIEVQGTLTDNPWTFRVKVPEEFLAHYAPVLGRANAETQPAEQPISHPPPPPAAQEVYTFSASRPRPPRPREPAPVEVIDLTFDDDIHPSRDEQPRVKRVRRPSSGKVEASTATASTAAATATATASPPEPSAANNNKNDINTNTAGIFDDVNEEFTCPICQELVVAAYMMVPCGHMFCGECLSGWLTNKQDCPTCRQKCTAPPVRQNAVDNVIAKTAASLNENDKATWEEKKASWEAKRSAFEEKLKSLDGRRGPGSSRGGNMLGHHGMFGLGVPGLDFLLQSLHGSRPSTSSVHRQVAEMEAIAAAQRRRIMELPRGSSGMTNPQRVHRNREMVAAPIGQPAPRRPVAMYQYRADYATGRERCEACNTTAGPGVLIMGLRPTPAGRHERTASSWRWYHFPCFPSDAFPQVRLMGVENLRNLLPADASRVRERIRL